MAHFTRAVLFTSRYWYGSDMLGLVTVFELTLNMAFLLARNVLAGQLTCWKVAVAQRHVGTLPDVSNRVAIVVKQSSDVLYRTTLYPEEP
ncbi:hypothetical protein H310_14492 [Aphanomyces invadans]|uniref:Uncharacterized protein n=1 Tax=Aphanomyces invadans TaxID=157072 RepID=A0A024T9S6_9STRA|nr:hypothetical protein H310_14492 [Aphanomyces invadans]ETV90754.1 hypothetical protein H310_14492 [Aphanomyces invadans]|eukprot:XP_008880590.1 hypothetical protein H310_14492 [Aphanomyces invadans]